MLLLPKPDFWDQVNAIVGATPRRFRPRYALANLGTRPVPMAAAMTQTPTGLGS